MGLCGALCVCVSSWFSPRTRQEDEVGLLIVFSFRCPCEGSWQKVAFPSLPRSEHPRVRSRSSSSVLVASADGRRADEVRAWAAWALCRLSRCKVGLKKVSVLPSVRAQRSRGSGAGAVGSCGEIAARHTTSGMTARLQRRNLVMHT